MKSEKVLAVARKYHERLTGQGFEPIRMPEELACGHNEYNPYEQGDYLQHACYMSQQIAVHLLNGDQDKAMRWLGYQQCLLVLTGFISLHEAKADNMPAGATFSRDA